MVETGYHSIMAGRIIHSIPTEKDMAGSNHTTVKVPFTKDIGNTVYHAFVISNLSLILNIIAKKMLKIKPANLADPDAENAIKLIASVSLAMFTRDYLVRVGWLKHDT